MTEAEWFAGTHPYHMIYYKGCRNDRKRRLLACACARRVVYLFPEDPFRMAIETSERYADGLATDDDLRAARRSAKKALDDPTRPILRECSAFAARSAICTLEKVFIRFKMPIEAAQAAQASLARPDWDDGHRHESLFQCAIVLDIFGNPFRPVTIDPTWLTPDVFRIARAIYDERRFAKLPELADALEAAACTEAGILAHCRGQGEHVRGCWVADLILGKT